MLGRLGRIGFEVVRVNVPNVRDVLRDGWDVLDSLLR